MSWFFFYKYEEPYIFLWFIHVHVLFVFHKVYFMYIHVHTTCRDILKHFQKINYLILKYHTMPYQMKKKFYTPPPTSIHQISYDDFKWPSKPNIGAWVPQQYSTQLYSTRLYSTHIIFHLPLYSTQLYSTSHYIPPCQYIPPLHYIPPCPISERFFKNWNV